MVSRRKILKLAGVYAALTGLPMDFARRGSGEISRIGIAHAQGNSGSGRGGGRGNSGGGGNGGGNGDGSGRGGGNAGGGNGDGRNGGSQSRGRDPGRNAAPRGTPSVPAATGTVVHENGMSETVRNGRYVMRDAQGRTIVDRPAALLDYLRMRSQP